MEKLPGAGQRAPADADSDESPSQAPSSKDQLSKQQITLRDGNIAYDIERPLFELPEMGIELPKLKADYTAKLADPSAVTSLPPMRYLKDLSDEVD